MSVIQVQDLEFRYSGDPSQRKILQDVSFTIEKGECVAILGPSGSGKSTLLYLLGCMVSAPLRSIFVGGVDVGLLSRDELSLLRNQKFGFIFQQFHLIPRMTILDNILLPLECSPLRLDQKHVRERAQILARRLGIEPLLGKFPNQLSGGQQQRVAIARALLLEPEILIADEPTGNLDSQTGKEIIDILLSLNAEGTTIVIVTHDEHVAQHCTRRIEVHDGRVVDCGSTERQIQTPVENKSLATSRKKGAALRRSSLSLSFFRNLRRNWFRSLLTMAGVAIGIASVLAMVTLGTYTESSILKTYEALGVNKFSFNARPNWQLKATDSIRTNFYEFTEQDLASVTRVFPNVARLSPVMTLWNTKALFGGREIDDASVTGVNEFYIPITRGELISGSSIMPRHVEFRSAVCVLGFEVAETLFRRNSPVGQTVFLGVGDSIYPCRVLGVLASRASPDQRNNLNKQILVPYTLAKMIADNPWSRRITSVVGQAQSGAEVGQISQGIEAFFKKKYGKSVLFQVSQNDVVVSQMKKFLSVFSLLLGSVALVALIIGGIGLTNMMLVSVAERYREIGVRKAVGASDRSISVLFLGESLVLCLIAGVFGLVLGFGVYQSLIWFASEFSERVEFAWVFDIRAVLISFSGIFAVGVLSGLVPAFKARKLQIIEALRSE